MIWVILYWWIFELIEYRRRKREGHLYNLSEPAEKYRRNSRYLMNGSLGWKLNYDPEGHGRSSCTKSPTISRLFPQFHYHPKWTSTEIENIPELNKRKEQSTQDHVVLSICGFILFVTMPCLGSWSVNDKLGNGLNWTEFSSVGSINSRPRWILLVYRSNRQQAIVEIGPGGKQRSSNSHWSSSWTIRQHLSDVPELSAEVSSNKLDWYLR